MCDKDTNSPEEMLKYIMQSNCSYCRSGTEGKSLPIDCRRCRASRYFNKISEILGKECKNGKEA